MFQNLSLCGRLSLPKSGMQFFAWARFEPTTATISNTDFIPELQGSSGLILRHQHDSLFNIKTDVIVRGAVLPGNLGISPEPTNEGASREPEGILGAVSSEEKTVFWVPLKFKAWQTHPQYGPTRASIQWTVSLSIEPHMPPAPQSTASNCDTIWNATQKFKLLNDQSSSESKA